MPITAGTTKSLDVKHHVDDEYSSILAKISAELAQSRQENARLKAAQDTLEREISDLKDEIKDKDTELRETQAALGQLVVLSKRQQGQSNAVAGPSRRPQPSPPLTRARSPSLELVETPEPPRKKQKQIEAYVTPPATAKVRNRAFVSVPARNSSGPLKPKAESSSQPQTSSTILKPVSKAVVYISGSSSTSSAALKNADRTLPHSSFPTTEVVKSSPSKIKLDKTTIQSKKVKAKRASENEDASSSTKYSASSEFPSPIEDKPKPTVKVKTKDVCILPDATVRQYLQSAKTLKITPPPLDLQVPRMFLRLAYGGSDQHFVQYIHSDMNPSGPVQRRIVFPMLDMNPAMPSRPGEPGLVFASRHEILENPPWTLFCKPSPSPAVWLYLGEYESALCGKMTAEQFKSQTLVVKKEWAKLILKMKAFDVYVSMRARIALRVASTLPAEDKETEEDLIKAEMQAVKNKKGLPVTEEDVITALSKGDEGIDIIRMTCVKYDHDFADDMKAKFANYDTLLAANAAASKRKKEEKEKDEAIAIPKKRGRKPKPKAQAQPQEVESEIDSNILPSDSDEEYVIRTGDDSAGLPTKASGSTTVALRPRQAGRKSVSVTDYFEQCFGGALTDDEED
ncbi:hypothetical protein GALMADRAFT_235162 [Galerina marginata CBS 339.88]|uniref:DUF6697 domain-containing protein n=1 Tax=Galerina marginata (strain CBS 339.88) TaxID=685588 RepID=A0A067U3I6_GALM3|nr:hypothetical protein GALMADRAFT_235162 [Galerina marginata CBS 339.88]